MLGDTDRESKFSADLQMDNPAFTSDDGEEPAEPAEQQQRGSIFAVFPEVLVLGRMPKAAHLFVMAAFVANGIGWGLTTPFVFGSMSGYEDPSALLWLAGAGFGVGNLLFSLVVGSLRLAVAPAAGLELLGINEMELSDGSIKSLKTWRMLLFYNGALPYLVFVCLVAAIPFLLSPEEYRSITNSIPVTGEFRLLLWCWYSTPVANLALGFLLFHSWFLSMKIGAALSAPKVQQVIDAVKRGRPAANTEDWHKTVTRRALDLHELMGLLTTVWGPSVGFFTLANWTCAAGILCFLLEQKFFSGLNDMFGLPGGTVWVAICVLLFT